MKRAREIRKFHVAIVQWRLRNVQKSVRYVRSCWFASLNLLLFCQSRWLSSHGCDPKFCYYGNVTSNFSLFLPWLICHLIYSQSLLQLTLLNVYLTIMSITQEERKMNWPFLKVLTFHSSCVSADGDCASSASLDLKKKNVISVNYSRRVSFNFVSRIAWEFHRDAIHVHQVSLGVLSV